MSKKTYMLLVTVEAKDRYQLERNINALNSDEIRIGNGKSYQVVDGETVATSIDGLSESICHDEMWQITSIMPTEFDDYDND